MWQSAHAIFISKTICVVLVGFFAALVAINNLLDYDSNFQFVVHVLSMDTTFEGNQLMHRAISSDWLHHIAYWFIIVTEAACGIICLVAAGYMAKGTLGASTPLYQRGKAIAVVGLTLGFMLWFGGFMVVGAEWFLMWQSESWNGQSAAFRFSSTMLGVLIFLSLPEDMKHA